MKNHEEKITKKIYTFGYSKCDVQKLYAAIKEMDGVLVDVRIAARSRVPAWNKGRLQEVFGQRYVHVRNLGNLNYQSDGPVEIVNLELGLKEVLILAQRRPVVLMCICKELCNCHRETIADALRESGIETEEFVIPEPPTMRTMNMFDALDEIEQQQGDVPALNGSRS